MYTYSFEKLELWQDARKLTVEIYQLTKVFPSEEKFSMVSQLRRAALSIASNIAEGSARKSPKDQGHFYQISYSNAIELLNQLIISNDLGFINQDQLFQLRLKIEAVANKLNALRNKTLNS